MIVLGVRRGTAAGYYGTVKPNDIIVRLNNRSVRSVKHLDKLVRERARRWHLTVKRKGRLLNLLIDG